MRFFAACVATVGFCLACGSPSADGGGNTVDEPGGGGGGSESSDCELESVMLEPGQDYTVTYFEALLAKTGNGCEYTVSVGDEVIHRGECATARASTIPEGETLPHASHLELGYRVLEGEDDDGLFREFHLDIAVADETWEQLSGEKYSVMTQAEQDANGGEFIVSLDYTQSRKLGATLEETQSDPDHLLTSCDWGYRANTNYELEFGSVERVCWNKDRFEYTAHGSLEASCFGYYGARIDEDGEMLDNETAVTIEVTW